MVDLRKSKEEYGSASSFQEQGEQHHVADQGRESGIGAMGEGVLNHAPLHEGKPASHNQYKHGGEGHYAQAAALDEHQHHPLTKEAQFATGINHNQAGNAGCRGGSKKPIHKAESGSVGCGR